MSSRQDAGDPDLGLDIFYQDSASESVSPRSLGARWTLIATLACLGWGLAFAIYLGVDVGFSPFEPSLEGMLERHPAFGALLFLAAPVHAVNSLASAWGGVLLGELGGRLVSTIIVASFAFPIGVLHAALVVGIAALAARLAAWAKSLRSRKS